MLIKCPECGKQISDKVEACPNCGAPQPASLRVAAMKQRRLMRRKVIRMTAIVLTVAILAAVVAFVALYRWPVSYRVGTVTGTDTVSREDLEKIVDYAAATWNRAAGRTVAWRLPLGRKVEFDLQVDASLQEYLTTLAGLKYDEAAFLAGKNSAEADLASVRAEYYVSINNPPTAVSTPPTGGRLDLSKYVLHNSPAGYRPSLQDVEKYNRITSAATAKWTNAYDRLQAFKKAGAYADDPSSIDAGVSLTEGSPTTVAIAYFANTYTLTDVVVHQFGRLLLGTWGTNDSPSSVTAAPLKSPWKLHLFGATNP